MGRRAPTRLREETSICTGPSHAPVQMCLHLYRAVSRPGTNVSISHLDQVMKQPGINVETFVLRQNNHWYKSHLSVCRFFLLNTPLYYLFPPTLSIPSFIYISSLLFSIFLSSLNLTSLSQGTGPAARSTDARSVGPAGGCTREGAAGSGTGGRGADTVWAGVGMAGQAAGEVLVVSSLCLC